MTQKHSNTLMTLLTLFAFLIPTTNAFAGAMCSSGGKEIPCADLPGYFWIVIGALIIVGIVLTVLWFVTLIRSIKRSQTGWIVSHFIFGPLTAIAYLLFGNGVTTAPITATGPLMSQDISQANIVPKKSMKWGRILLGVVIIAGIYALALFAQKKLNEFRPVKSEQVQEAVNESSEKVEEKTISSILGDNNEPMYGFLSYEDYSIHRSAQQAEIDDSFIKLALNNEKDLKLASSGMVYLGFEYLQKKDFDTAIKRFNQGWLIDHNNHNVYWGFAIYMWETVGYEATLKYFDMALEKFNEEYLTSFDDKERLHCDAAMGYASAYVDSRETNKAYVQKVKALLPPNVDLNPKNINPPCAALISDLNSGKLN